MNYQVVVVDDHTLLSQAIGDMVNGLKDFTCIYTCKHGKELLQRMINPTMRPDIILMDVSMPVLDGIETTVEIRKTYLDIKVIALSMDDREETIIKMLRAGANGYLLKDTPKNELENALLETMQYGFYHTNTVTKLLMNQLNGENRNDQFELTERELEFINFACSDMTYREIAEKMFVSPKTIDNYRDSVFTKFQVKNRIGMVLFAIKNNIIHI